jgi:hypothetical protein
VNDPARAACAALAVLRVPRRLGRADSLASGLRSLSGWTLRDQGQVMVLLSRTATAPAVSGDEALVPPKVV